MTHPYKTFRVIPSPSSEVVADIDPLALKKALAAHLKKITVRNIALIPNDIYQALKAAKVAALSIF